MDKESREKVFLQKALELHGDFFGYDKFEYIAAKVPSIVTCPKHGEFLQSPANHLRSKHACQQCWDVERKAIMKGAPGKPGKRTTKEEYLSKLNLPQGYSVNLDKFDGMSHGSVELICPVHGNHEYPPRALLVSEYKCKQCGWKAAADFKLKGYSSFIEKVEKLHNNKYTYPFPEEYENRKSMLTIVCSDHGIFKKTAQKHLAGQGCNRCRLDKLIDDGILIGGYCEGFFKSYPELEKAEGLVYYLKVGSAYKIGITRNKLQGRLRSIKSESKREVKVIDTYTTTLRNAFDIEQKILSDFAEDRTFRRWSTEVFDKDVLRGGTIESYVSEILLNPATSSK